MKMKWAVASRLKNAQGASPEQIIIREVQSIVDSSHAVEAEKILVRGGALAVCLQTHIQSLFLGNTEEGSKNEIR